MLSSLRLLSGDLRLLFVSLFLWTFGFGLYNYIWSIFLRDIGANSDQVGIVYVVGFLAAALTMIPGGILANKYDLKAIIILGWAVSVPPPILYYFAHSWTEAIPGFIVLQLSAFNVPAFNAYIANAAGKGRQSSAFGATYSAAPLGAVLSPAVGGLLLTWMTIRELFILAALFFTISTLVLLPIQSQPAIEAEAKAPLLELPRTRRQRILLTYLFLAALAFSLTSPFLPLYYRDLFGLSDSQIQLVGAIQSLGGATLAVFLGRRAETSGKGKTIAFGLLLAGLGLAGLVFLRNPFAILPFVFLAGGARMPSLVAYSALSSEGGKTTRGGRFGFYLTLESLGLAAGPYLGGALYGLDPTIVLVTTAVSFMLLAALSVREITES